jgi:hypothetical protein
LKKRFNCFNIFFNYFWNFKASLQFL